MSAFGIFALILFPAAGLGAMIVIARMLADYSDKMIAALLFEPMPGQHRHARRA